MKLSLHCNYQGNSAQCRIMDEGRIIGNLEYTKSQSPHSFKQSVSFKSTIGGLKEMSDFSHRSQIPPSELTSIQQSLNNLQKQLNSYTLDDW